jgi:hypothetical protein
MIGRDRKHRLGLTALDAPLTRREAVAARLRRAVVAVVVCAAMLVTVAGRAGAPPVSPLPADGDPARAMTARGANAGIAAAAAVGIAAAIAATIQPEQAPVSTSIPPSTVAR